MHVTEWTRPKHIFEINIRINDLPIGTAEVTEKVPTQVDKFKTLFHQKFVYYSAQWKI